MFTTIHAFVSNALNHLTNAFNRAKQALQRAILASLARMAKRAIVNEVETIALNIAPIAIPSLQILAWYQTYVGLETISLIMTNYFASAFVASAWHFALVALLIAFVSFVLVGYMQALRQKYMCIRLS